MSLCDESFSWRIFESSVSFGSLSGWFAKMEQYDFISTYQVFQKESGALSTRGTLWWSGGLDCSPCTSHKTLSSCRLLSPAGTLKRKCLWADRYCQPHTMNLEHIWGFQEDGSKGHLWSWVCTMKDFRLVGSPGCSRRTDAQTRTSHLRFLIASHTIQISQSDDDYLMPTLRFSLVFGPSSSLHNTWTKTRGWAQGIS